MKVTITKSQIEEVEIKLPAFRKFSDGLVYKIVTEKDAISVSHDGIRVCLPSSAMDRTVDCTESEFNEVYDKTMEYLSELTFNTK